MFEGGVVFHTGRAMFEETKTLMVTIHTIIR